MREKIVYSIIGIIILSTGVLLFWLGQRSHTETAEKKVAVTIFGIHDAVARVAGSTLRVVQMLPSGQSPHTFDPSPALIQELSNISATFTVGGGIDDWVKPIAENAAPSAPIIPVTKNIPLICTSQTATAEEEPCNPHVWVSLKNMEIITDNVAEELARLFPENADTFYRNAATYKAELLTADADIAKMFSVTKPKPFLTFHDAFTYFARDYNLNIAGTLEPFPGKEPTATYIHEIQQKIQTLGVTTLFREPELSDAAVQSLAQDEHLNIETLDSAESSPSSTTFIEVMRKNAQTISAAK